MNFNIILESNNGTCSIIEKMKSTINIQRKQIELYKAELDSLKKEFHKINEFPKVQFSYLKKYNGITQSKDVICFVIFRDHPFGIMTGRLVASYKGKSNIKLNVSFEESTQNIEVSGRIWETKIGISIFEINNEKLSKGLKEHCLILNEILPGQILDLGSRIVTYAPSLQILTGYVLSKEPIPNGELHCQLDAEELYSGAIVFDEALLPIGICSVYNPEQIRKDNSRVKLSSMLPLTINIQNPDLCKVIPMEKIM